MQVQSLRRAWTRFNALQRPSLNSQIVLNMESSIFTLYLVLPEIYVAGSGFRIDLG